MSNFWGYVEEEAEPLEPDEIEARNMTLLAEIEYEDGKLEVEECELDLELFVVERLLLNEYLQETILTSSERKDQRTEEGTESVGKEHPQDSRRIEGESTRAQETFR
jgi:hypothetical protein